MDVHHRLQLIVTIGFALIVSTSNAATIRFELSGTWHGGEFGCNTGPLCALVETPFTALVSFPTSGVDTEPGSATPGVYKFPNTGASFTLDAAGLEFDLDLPGELTVIVFNDRPEPVYDTSAAGPPFTDYFSAGFSFDDYEIYIFSSIKNGTEPPGAFASDGIPTPSEIMSTVVFGIGIYSLSDPGVAIGTTIDQGVAVPPVPTDLAANITSNKIIVIPELLNPGDQYRLVFVTSTTRDATSTDIADYNDFVTAVANTQPELAALGTTWTAIASTATVEARDNTNTNPDTEVGVQIYGLDGKFIALNYQHLWDRNRSLVFGVGTTEKGTGSLYSIAWTGTTAAGVENRHEV